MICDRHKIDTDLCNHRWNEILSCVHYNKHNDNWLLNSDKSNRNFNNSSYNKNDYKKILASFTVDNIAKKLLKKKKYKPKPKINNNNNNTMLVKDLGFSNLQNVQVPLHNFEYRQSYDNEPSMQNIFDSKYNDNINRNSFEVGFQIDFDKTQILPPTYAPSVYKLYNYSY